MTPASGATTSLIGRNRELSLLRVMLAAALDGGGGLVLLGGEAGIGKTRLARELTGIAEARGARVARGSGADDDLAPPYRPWVQVLRDCARASGSEPRSRPGARAAELADLLPGALPPAEAAPWPVSPAESQQLRFRLFDGVATVLQEAARTRPVVVVLDDLHGAHTSSLLLLEFVANQLQGHRLLILGVYRDSELPAGSPLSQALARLSRLGTPIGLSGLTADESMRLMGDIAGTALSDRVAMLVHERTAGNPFFIHEVVRLLASQGRLTALSQRGASRLSMLPQTVGEVISQRSAQLSRDTALPLAGASVLGDEFGVDVLAALTGAPEAGLLDRLGEAERAEMIQRSEDAPARYRFAHPLIRDMLYHDIPASRRADLHRRAGEVLEVRSDDLDSQVSTLAHHFHLGSPAGTREKALHYAQRAGWRALRLLAYEEAAEHFTLGLELLDQLYDEESQQMELLLALGDARMRAGDWPGAVDAYERAAASARLRGRAGELARAALGLGAGLSGFEVRLFDQRQIDLLEEARAALGQEDSALRAWVLTRLSVARTARESPAQRADLSHQAVEIARQVGDAKALAYALSSYCDAISNASHAEERLECAVEMVRIGEETRDGEIELLGRRFRVTALLEMGDISAVDAEIEAFERTADALRQPMFLWYVPLWRGMRALMEGRLVDSERLITEARAIGRRAGSVNADRLADAQGLRWLIESGQNQQARDLLARFLDDPEGGPNAEPFVVPLLARLGRPAEAHAILSRLAAEDFSQLQVEDSGWVLAMCMLAWGCTEIADREAGAKVYAILRPFAQRFALSGPGAVTVGSVYRYLGLLAHLLGRSLEAHAHFRRALEAHRRAGASLLIAHTLRQHADMLLERGEPGDQGAGEALLGEAISTYTELGLTHWAEEAARELPRPEPEPAPRAAETSGGAEVFRREGDLWLLRFDGQETRVTDTKGLRLIARLLANPGREFHVLDLVSDTGSAPKDPRVDGLHEQGHDGAMIDEWVRAEYKQRLGELEEDIEEAETRGDPERASRAHAEREAIIAELAAAYGDSGRPRRAGDPAERARSDVAWRIRSAARRIERAHPTLGRHLRDSIRTGMLCSYSPESTTSWTVE